MNIILVGPSNRFHGGISSYLEVTAKSLASQGHSVGLVLFDRLIPRLLYPGKERVNLNPNLEFEEEGISTLHVMNYYNFLIPKKSKKRISDFEPDFAILHWWTFAVYPMSRLISRFLRKSGCPIFYEMHEVIDQNDELNFFTVVSSPDIYLPIFGFIIIIFIKIILKKFFFK